MFAAAYVSVRTPALSCHSWISACGDSCPFSYCSTFLFFFSYIFPSICILAWLILQNLTTFILPHCLIFFRILNSHCSFFAFALTKGTARFLGTHQRWQLRFLKMFLVPNASSLKLPGWQTISISTVQQTFYSVK